MTTPHTARPTGFWQVPPEVWADEQAMSEFAERVADHMTAVSETDEAEHEGEETQDG